MILYERCEFALISSFFKKNFKKNCGVQAIFGSGGAIAGILGSAAIAVKVEGLPTQGRNETEIEFEGLPLRGKVRVGKEGVLQWLPHIPF